MRKLSASARRMLLSRFVSPPLPLATLYPSHQNERIEYVVGKEEQSALDVEGRGLGPVFPSSAKVLISQIGF